MTEIVHEYREGEAQFASATGHREDEEAPVIPADDDFPLFTDRERPDDWATYSDEQKREYVNSGKTPSDVSDEAKSDGDSSQADSPVVSDPQNVDTTNDAPAGPVNPTPTGNGNGGSNE